MCSSSGDGLVMLLLGAVTSLLRGWTTLSMETAGWQCHRAQQRIQVGGVGMSRSVVEVSHDMLLDAVWYVFLGRFAV
jgi:hypothetical protein